MTAHTAEDLDTATDNNQERRSLLGLNVVRQDSLRA